MKQTVCRVLTTLLFLCITVGRLLAATPDSEELFRRAGDLQGSGDLPAAMQVLRQVPQPAAGADEEDFVRSRMQIARIHFSLGELDQAETAAQEVDRKSTRLNSSHRL